MKELKECLKALGFMILNFVGIVIVSLVLLFLCFSPFFICIFDR